MSEKKEPLPSIDRTSSGLRDALLDEIDAMRAGESNATRANAVAKLASQVVDTVRMEMEVQRHAEKVAASATAIGDAKLPTALALGVAA